MILAARDAILRTAEGANADIHPVDLPASLMEKCGAFVTLRIDGALRGCIGQVAGTLPLYDTVIAAAISAATQDPRFNPVSKDEVEKVSIDISVLSAPCQVDTWRDIKIGVHGILLKRDDRQAVYLPQVAVEQGWDLETTLDNLAAKAGLGAGEWRDGATFEVFTAEVIEEDRSGK